jgi:hypothetical protein
MESKSEKILREAERAVIHEFMETVFDAEFLWNWINSFDYLNPDEQKELFDIMVFFQQKHYLDYLKNYEDDVENWRKLSMADYEKVLKYLIEKKINKDFESNYRNN